MRLNAPPHISYKRRHFDREAACQSLSQGASRKRERKGKKKKESRKSFAKE